MFVRQRTIARFSSKIQSRNGKALVALSAATACVALTQRSWADTYGSNGQLNLSQASSWIDETTPANTGVDVPSSNDIAQFDSDAALSATTTFTLGAQTSWLGLSVINPGAAVVIGGGSDTGNTLTIGADGINMSAAAQNLTLSDPLNLNTTQSLQTNTGFTFTNSTTTSLNGNLTVTGSGNATFTGAINAGSNNITMNGTGTLTLTAANAITGNTTLNSGTIYLATASGNATTNSSAGTGTIFLNGGTVHFTGSTSGANGYYNPIVVGSATTTTIAGGVQLAGNITGTGTLDIAVGSGSTVSLMATAGMLSSYDGYIEMGTSAGALRFNGVTGGSGFGLDMGTATATLNTRTAGTFTIGSLAGGASTIVEGSTSSNSGDNYTIGGLGATTTFAGTLENGTDGSSATTAITLTGGSLTLTGTDTYSGGTTISGGTLQIGNNTTSGSFGSGAVSDGSALVISRSDAAVSFSNAISGTGSLTNNGSGTVTLTGNNSFGGGTTISAGVLQADNATSALGTGAVLVGSSATLGGIGNITAAVSIASGASLSPGDAGVNHGGGAGVGTLTMSSLTLQPGSILNYEFGPGANDLTDVTGSNGLTVNGGGINLYQANSTSPFDTDGTYDIFQLSSAYSGSVTNLLSVLNAQGGVSYTWGSSGDFITLTINGGAASTAWNMAGGSSWAMARNWTAGVPNSVGASATLGSAITGPSTITLDGSQTVGTLVFNNNSGGSGTSYTVAAGANSGNLTFDNGGSTATAYISDISGNHAISAPVTLNSQLSVAISSATNTLTISGAIGGVGGINESGNGIVVLSGNNTYGGTTTITSGTLQVGAGGTTGSLGTNTSSISDSAVLAFNMSGTTTLSNVVTGSGALTQEGTGTLILATDNTYTGATNINSGTVQIATGETTALNNGNVAFGGTGGVLDINGNNISIATISGTVGTIDNVTAGGTPTLTFNTGGTQSFSGTIKNSSGTMSVVKSGSSTLTLAGNNTYSGGTTISAGAINVDSNSALGTGTITVTPSTGLQLSGGITVSNPIVDNVNNVEFEDVPTAGTTATIAGNVTMDATSEQYRIGTSANTGGDPTSTLIMTGTSTGNAQDALFTRGNIFFESTGSFTGTALVVLGRSSTTSELNLTIQDNASVTGVGIDVGGLGGSSDDLATTINITGDGSLSSGTGAFNINDSSVDSPVAGTSITLSDNATLAAGSFTILNNSSNDIGSTALSINSGTLAANASDPSATQAWFPALSNSGGSIAFDVNGATTLNNNGHSITIAQEIDGGGSITFTGTGTTVLTTDTNTGSSNTYNGGSTLAMGTLVIANASVGSAIGSGNITLNGGVLASAATGGIISGAVIAGSGAHTIAPGGIGSFGTLTVGSITTNSNTTFDFDLGAPVVAGSYSGDLIDLTSGPLTVGSGTQITFGTNPTTPGDYELFTGSFGSPTLANFTLPTQAGYGYSLSTTAQSGFIDLVVVSTGPATVYWDNLGAGSPTNGTTWDTTNNNWNSGSAATTYATGDNVVFNDTNAGHYFVTLSSTVSPASVTVNSSGNYSITGTGGLIVATGGFTKTGTSTLTLGVGLSATGMAISGGNVVLASNTTASSGWTSTNPVSNINVSSLTIAANSVLDISNNHIIIDYGASDPMSTILGYLKSGFNNGAWNGTSGIISSSAQTKTNGLTYSVGWADGNDKTGAVKNLTSGEIELKYTLVGDANLDGTVNGSDFSILAANFGLGVTNWDQGNFLYTSSVNGSDFSALAANFGQGDSGAAVTVTPADVAALDAFAAANGLPAPTIAAVPEPATLGILAMGAAGLMARRRRR